MWKVGIGSTVVGDCGHHVFAVLVLTLILSTLSLRLEKGGPVRRRRFLAAPAARVTLAISLAVGISAVGNGCSLIGGGEMSDRDTAKVNLANQRQAALVFRRGYHNPDLTAVQFTHEGDSPAFGAGWSANAVATVSGREYDVILAKDFWGGEQMPRPLPDASPGPVKVIYSDGSSEVLQ
jgi:hypothetical protein